MKSSKEVRFLCDHDDFLYDIMELVPAWNLDVIENVLKINMIFNLQGNVIAIPFNFDLKRGLQKCSYNAWREWQI